MSTKMESEIKNQKYTDYNKSLQDRISDGQNVKDFHQF